MKRRGFLLAPCCWYAVPVFALSNLNERGSLSVQGDRQLSLVRTDGVSPEVIRLDLAPDTTSMRSMPFLELDSPPVKVGDVLNIVVGVNEHLYNPARDRIVTAASCTTNCLAPVVKVVHEAIGIRHGQITTLHNPTNTNLVVDAPHKDLRRARSAMVNLAPTTTGSATAIALIYPELKGKLNGHAVRVPALNASLTDCVFELNRATTAEEVNALFEAAAKGPLAGILGYESRPLVSADYARDTRSSIVDGLSTMVTDGTLLKVYAWYDNEMGYATRMVDLACHLDAQGL